MTLAAMNDSQFAAHLAAIAMRVERLGQTRRDPENFHVEKSDIVCALRAAAHVARVRDIHHREPSTTWRPPYSV